MSPKNQTKIKKKKLRRTFENENLVGTSMVSIVDVGLVREFPLIER